MVAASVRRRDSAFAVILRRARVLLVRSRRRNRWQLPGGGLKRAETPREAARREVGEETGLVARVHGLTGTYRRSDGSVALVFIASVAPWAELCGPTDEIRCQRWVPQDEALELLSQRARRRLADALREPVATSVAARGSRRSAWIRVYA
jgi:8-oxo-dGTP pyrophosphatase MutT (NUDIX family)